VEFASRVGEASLVEAAKLAKDPRVVWRRGKGPKEWIVGEGDSGMLRLLRGEGNGKTLVDELRSVEQQAGTQEKGLGAILGALLSAGRACADGLKEIQGTPAFFAQLADERQTGVTSAWDEAMLEERVSQCLRQVGEGGGLCSPSGGALDAACFWLTLGERLWDGGVRKLLSAAHPGETTRRLLMMLAGSWMELRSEGSVVFRGCHFRLQGPARRIAWPQVMEWEAGEIEPRVLKYLTAYHTDFRFDGILTGLLGLEAGEAEPIGALVAASESRALLQEAALRWVCDPRGSFRVDIPPRTPLTQWGVTSLRVWILRGEGFWVALEKDEQPGASLQWSVRPPHLRRWVVHEGAIPGIHLTLSALWRDLKIGGRQAILAEEPVPPEGDEPRERKLRLHGRIRWGSEEELARILREAYPVEEHVRVLARGKRASRRAYKLALREGHVLRPGTTFVRKHTRGKPDETVTNIPVRAQGLARLILASRLGSEKRLGIPGR